VWVVGARWMRGGFWMLRLAGMTLGGREEEEGTQGTQGTYRTNRAVWGEVDAGDLGEYEIRPYKPRTRGEVGRRKESEKKGPAVFDRARGVAL